MYITSRYHSHRGADKQHLFTFLFSVAFVNRLVSSLILFVAYNVEMAWRSSGPTNTALVENLCKNGFIKDARVKNAFLKVITPIFWTWEV